MFPVRLVGDKKVAVRVKGHPESARTAGDDSKEGGALLQEPGGIRRYLVTGGGNRVRRPASVVGTAYETDRCGGRKRQIAVGHVGRGVGHVLVDLVDRGEDYLAAGVGHGGNRAFDNRMAGTLRDLNQFAGGRPAERIFEQNRDRRLAVAVGRNCRRQGVEPRAGCRRGCKGQTWRLRQFEGVCRISCGQSNRFGQGIGNFEGNRAVVGVGNAAWRRNLGASAGIGSQDHGFAADDASACVTQLDLHKTGRRAVAWSVCGDGAHLRDRGAGWSGGRFGQLQIQFTQIWRAQANVKKVALQTDSRMKRAGR